MTKYFALKVKVPRNIDSIQYKFDMDICYYLPNVMADYMEESYEVNQVFFHEGTYLRTREFRLPSHITEVNIYIKLNNNVIKIYKLSTFSSRGNYRYRELPTTLAVTKPEFDNTKEVRVNLQRKTIDPRRPSWRSVYQGYPLNSSGNDDLSAKQVFTSLRGPNYDYKTLNNACATRVSLGLLNGGMWLPKHFEINQRNHKFYDKGFIASARGLKNYLSRDNVWGKADVIIEKPQDLASVARLINSPNGQIKNGVYIIVGAFPNTRISGHATLWIGKNADVVGGHNYIRGQGEIHFWELQ